MRLPSAVLTTSILLVAASVASPAYARDAADDRARWGLVRDWQDLQGNRDEIWENEDLAAGERGWFRGGVERPSKAELEAFRVWKVARTGGATVGTTGNEIIEGHAVNAMERYGRRPSEFDDAIVKSPALGDSPARDVYVQRWNATGEQKVVTVIVPGYTESTLDWTHVANRMNAAGSRVYVFDPPGQGMSSGNRGDMESAEEWLSAYRTVLAKAQAENPGAKIVVMGHSTGGGVVLDDLHDRVNGQVHTRGPDGLALSAPYLDMRPNVMNAVSGVLARIPLMNRLQVPPLVKLSEDALGQRRLAQWQKATGARQTLHFMKELGEVGLRHEAWLEGETGITIPVSITQGKDDSVTNPAASRRFAEKTPGARFRDVETGSHDLQHDAAGLEALMGSWQQTVEETLGANPARNESTRSAAPTHAGGGGGGGVSR